MAHKSKVPAKTPGQKKWRFAEHPNVRNFLIAFVAGLVVFGAVAVAIPVILQSTGVVTPSKTPGNTAGNTVSREDEEQPLEPVSSSFTAVLGGYDADSGALDALLFVKADKENSRFVLASIPTDYSYQTVSVNTETEETIGAQLTLKDIPLRTSKSERATHIVDIVHAITGMNIDYYAFFNMSTLLTLFEKTGGLYYEVPQDMIYIGLGTAADPEISIKAGAQVLNAKQCLGLLRFRDYTINEHTNSVRRAQTQVAFISSALKQILKQDTEKLLQGAAVILADCETNFSVADLKDHYDLISKFSEYSAASSAFTLEYPGTLDFSRTQKLFENYK